MVGRCGLVRNDPRVRPGHTPRACSARTRPFRWERKGQNVVRRDDGGRARFSTVRRLLR